MEAYWFTCIFALVATLHLFFRRFCSRKVLNLPPGPKPWPLIGNLDLIGTSPHRSIHELSKTYGPIMQLQLGSFPFVVGSSVEMAKYFLKTHDLNFASRPDTAVGKHLTYNYSNVTWASYGSHWRQARKIFLVELFNAKRLKSMEYIRKEEMTCFLKEIYMSTTTTTTTETNMGMSMGSITLKHYIWKMSFNLITRMTMGKKYLDGLEKNALFGPKEFPKMMDEFLYLTGALNIGDFIPWIDFLDLQGNVKRMKVLHKKMDRFFEHVLDEHNQKRNGIKDYVAKDIVDVLLQLVDDSNLEVKLERYVVKALIQDLLPGATNNPTIIIEWAISELLKNPEILKKAHNELDIVIGKERWVEETDLINLPYIDAIMKETMRLHPVIPILVPRMAREDCQIDGYDIPKGTRIFMNIWTIGRDPSIWENPTEFNPDRFIGKDINIKGQNYELLPFGSGRRMCPAYSLGLKVVQSTLANLLHGFSWKLPKNMKMEDLNMDENDIGFITPKKIPLITVPEPRLPPHIYSV